MDVIKKIEGARFLATEHDIELMARVRQDGIDQEAKITGTYLKVLVALTAHAIGGKTAHLSRRRGKLASGLQPNEVADHLATLESVNSMCYGAVQKAVITSDVEQSEELAPSEKSRRALERNRRTNYARTAMTAVRMFVEAGRDVRDVDVRSVTKGWLRETAERYAPPVPSVSTARLLRAATRAGERIVAEAEELATIDPDQAEALLTALVDQLSDTLERIKAGDVGDVGGTTTVVENRVRAAAQRPALRRAA
jgi:hypothetical protein